MWTISPSIYSGRQYVLACVERSPSGGFSTNETLVGMRAACPPCMWLCREPGDLALETCSSVGKRSRVGFR